MSGWRERPWHYMLIGHDPVPCRVDRLRPGQGDELLAWSVWYAQTDRRVALDYIDSDAGEKVEVSTVFLAMDHNWSEFGEPILFETMVFGGVLDLHQWRYTTWEEAEAGHAEVVRIAQGMEAIDAAPGRSQAQALAERVIARWRGKAEKPG